MAHPTPYDPRSHLDRIAGDRGHRVGVDLHYQAARPLRPWPPWDEDSRQGAWVRARCVSLVVGLAEDPAELDRLARVCAEEMGRGYYGGAWQIWPGMPASYVEPGRR